MNQMVNPRDNSLNRLNRFLDWAGKSVPDFLRPNKHPAVWYEFYHTSKNPLMKTAAMAFQIGLDTATVEDLLATRPQGILANIIERKKQPLTTVIEYQGIQLCAGISKAGSLVTTYISNDLRDSFSLQDLEQAFQEMITAKVAKSFRGLGHRLSTLTLDEQGAIFPDKVFINDLDNYKNLVIQRLNVLDFDLKVTVKLNHGEFSMDVHRTVSPKPELLTEESLKALKTQEKSSYKRRFNALVKCADGFDLRLIEPAILRKLIESKPAQLETQFKTFREKHKEQTAMASLMEDPRFAMYHQLYDARKMQRTWKAYLGPTNSGKTHEALQAMIKSQRAIYLAPLRLMALENQERLEAAGVPCSLVTGEEQVIREGASHFCCTIEAFAQFRDDLWDVVVVDEAQMLTDPSRGWAWVDALVSAQAPELYVTGPKLIEPSLHKLAHICGDLIQTVDTTRLSPVEVAQHPTKIAELPSGSILVAFSRKDVLELKGVVEAGGRTASVVYGALSPETRREQARRFRDGEAEIMVATDAIGMGLNLPASVVCFYADEKFDGLSYRQLSASEFKQIGGRAGRFGMAGDGIVTALDKITLKAITAAFKTEEQPVHISKFNIRPSLGHLEMINKAMGTNSLLKAWGVFIRNVNFGNLYRSILPAEMEGWITAIDSPKYSLRLRWTFACTPIKGGLDGRCAAAVMSWLPRVAEGAEIPLPPNMGPCGDLKTMEDELHVIEAYLSLARSFGHLFTDIVKAEEMRNVLNQAITAYLSKVRKAQGRGIKLLTRGPKRCSSCSSVIPMSFEYALCGSCYRSQRGDYFY